MYPDGQISMTIKNRNSMSIFKLKYFVTNRVQVDTFLADLLIQVETQAEKIGGIS